MTQEEKLLNEITKQLKESNISNELIENNWLRQLAENVTNLRNDLNELKKGGVK